MKDILLMSAGVVGMVTAVVHGVIGETRLIGPLEDISPLGKRALRVVFQLSTWYWFVGGALLVATPYYLDASQRTAAVLGVGFLYASGSVGNFWIARGRHFGWVLLAAATALAFAGR